MNTPLLINKFVYVDYNMYLCDMDKQLTGVEWLAKELESYGDPQCCKITWEDLDSLVEQAKQMDQRCYTKEDVLKAGEIGEINHHDYKHIVSLLDEAREINQRFGSGD